MELPFHFFSQKKMIGEELKKLEEKDGILLARRSADYQAIRKKIIIYKQKRKTWKRKPEIYSIGI